MWCSLISYLVAFLIYVFLYDFYRSRIRKTIVNLDILQNLESIQLNYTLTPHRKTFNQIKQEISSYFYFDHIRIIFGIDLSASNELHGNKTFSGQSLHKISGNKIYNPYQKAINQLGPMFEEIFSNKIEYSCFGFGDDHTKDFAVFPIVGTGDHFQNYKRILDAYLERTKTTVLSGPTTFIPIINKLISFGVHYRKDFTMLVILTDELKVTHKDSTFVELIRGLTNLSNTCLIIIGVGDGPWSRISYEEHCLRDLVFKKHKKTLDKEIPQSKISYDNFHFVDINPFIGKNDKNYNENYLAGTVLKKLPTHLKLAFKHDDNKAHF